MLHELGAHPPHARRARRGWGILNPTLTWRHTPTHAVAYRGRSGRWREGGTTESDEGAATGEDATTAANTAKGVAGGLHDVARNEPLRKAGTPSDRPRTTSARAEARCLRLRNEASSRQRAAAVDCRTTGWTSFVRQPQRVTCYPSCTFSPCFLSISAVHPSISAAPLRSSSRRGSGTSLNGFPENTE